MPPTYYLIDGHALAYRAYFALTGGGDPARWRTSTGEPTAGVFGFVSVMLRILEQERPDYLAVAFDTGKTFRDEMYPEYKATRAKMPDDLRPQIERIRQLVDAFNIPRLEMEGYEADDVLGSAARIAAAQGLGVKIITGDRDLLQLVNRSVIVNLPSGSLADAKDYYADDVQDYWGILPEQVVDFKALVGDKSDNIPGVAGIGEKTAASLLQQYQTLEGIYEHLDELKPGVRSKLVEGRQSADISRTLARIVTDLDVDLQLERARPDQFNPQEVLEIFRQMEFRTLRTRLETLMASYGMSAASAAPAQQLSLFAREEPAPYRVESPTGAGHSGAQETETVLVDSPQALSDLAKNLAEAEWIAFDTETTSTDPVRADLVGISLAVKEGQGYYVPIGHRRAEAGQLGLKQVLDALRPALTAPAIPKAGHNLKYDYIMLARFGLQVTPLSFDTMIAEWLTNPDSRNLGLKNLAFARLGVQMTEIDQLIGKGKNQITMADVPVGDAAAYAAADADISLRLVKLLHAELQERGALQLFQQIEMPLVAVLAQMEMDGVALDTDFLAGMAVELDQRLLEIQQKIFAETGYEFNLNSPQQLSKALFESLRLEPPDRTNKTSTGFYSTSASVLEALSGSHPAVDWVLEYRELSKIKSTYVDALPLQVNPRTGRVHTSYNQTGSVTGRIASSDPNLQNIPIRSEIGRKVRRAFVASPVSLLLAVDYSQVELRIAAHMSGDAGMTSAFLAGQDIHTATAAGIYGVPIDQVTSAMRRHAKAINFGLIYGMSAFGLTRSSELTLAEAENFVSAYFKQFPGVKKYLDGIRVQAAQEGYVETLLGRRRYFPELKTASNQNIRSRAEREAINAPIQGTAADIIKIAMIRMPEALRQAGLQVRMLLQVHDELVFECLQSELDATIAVVRQVMQEAYPLNVPLMTEARYGKNWGELQVAA